jgi:hypothetical protein
MRTAVDAIAHPGKLRAIPSGARRAALTQLHELATRAAWPQLRDALHDEAWAPDDLHAPLDALRASPALQRLVRGAELLARAPVQRHVALCARRGPLAGSHAAAAQGRASARLGDDAEAATVAAFREIAALLDAHAAAPASHRVLRGLHTPRGFPGEASKSKSEWDAAIVSGPARSEGAHVLLLAEVKASPAAASPDLSRLRRGLQRLALADPQQAYVFRTAEGDVCVAGASLHALQPPGHALPPQVVYCCTAANDAPVQVLAAASKSVLAAEPASIGFALRLARDEAPSPQDLAPVWEALSNAPRLRATLHQYDTARIVREAMLHPDDLLAAVADACRGPG